MDPQSRKIAQVGRSTGAPGHRKHPVRPTPEKTELHAHLTRDGLRSYRKALTA